jgi:phage recombination protein Bet
MAVQNSLLKQEDKKKSLVMEFKAGDENVKLSPKIVKSYLVSGDAEKVTDQEVMMFMMLCKNQHLNPFLREAYLIKYGSQPATIVTGKAAFEKRANRCASYEGFEAGIVVVNANGELEYRIGTLVLPSETLVGGWADVFVKDYKKPVRSVVSLDEYIGRKNDGTVNRQWSGKPATMIRKVAKMQALREAFPEDLQGMYAAEEVDSGISDEQIAPPIDITPSAEVVEHSEPASEPPVAELDSFDDIMTGEFTANA